MFKIFYVCGLPSSWLDTVSLTEQKFLLLVKSILLCLSWMVLLMYFKVIAKPEVSYLSGVNIVHFAFRSVIHFQFISRKGGVVGECVGFQTQDFRLMVPGLEELTVTLLRWGLMGGPRLTGGMPWEGDSEVIKT